jgi:hypothetical protein
MLNLTREPIRSPLEALGWSGLADIFRNDDVSSGDEPGAQIECIESVLADARALRRFVGTLSDAEIESAVNLLGALLPSTAWTGPRAAVKA